jgi:hypothetical protein
MSITLKDWVNNKIKAGDWTASEILQNGCVGGFSGLIYYRETVALHDLYEDEIWECLNSCAEDCGMTVPEFLDTVMKCPMGSMDSFKNNLVWLAVERICQDLEREKEEAA